MKKQPSNGGGEENAASAPSMEHKISSGVNPDQGPKSVNENDNNENESIKSANGVNKSKKSVHWSEELVTESSVPRITADPGLNPYLAHSPAPANNSVSFNVKS